MDLWIRSQDRQTLVKTHEISLDLTTKRKLIANYEDYGDSENYVTLGTYKTKERALEVLDYIQTWIANINRERNNGRARDNTNEAYDEIFKMPEE